MRGGPGTAYDADTSWRDEAACVGADWRIFFPEKGTSQAEARSYCLVCPVRQRCLDFALANNEDTGIWGGKSTRQRRTMRRHRRAEL